MLKVKYLTLFLILSSCLHSFSQVQGTATEMIRQNMHKQEVSWNKADVEGFMNYYWKSDSLKFIGSKGITHGWQKTFDNYKKNYPDQATMGILTFEILEIDLLSKSSAFVIGKWNLKRVKGDVGGHFSLLWKKLDGKWVIVTDHTS
jgi:hypothetical protein